MAAPMGERCSKAFWGRLPDGPVRLARFFFLTNTGSAERRCHCCAFRAVGLPGRARRNAVIARRQFRNIRLSSPAYQQCGREMLDAVRRPAVSRAASHTRTGHDRRTPPPPHHEIQRPAGPAPACHRGIRHAPAHHHLRPAGDRRYRRTRQRGCHTLGKRSRQVLES